jgi:LacI family transcriptional regulator
MNKRLTLHDVARDAGVSSATADRVLNNRKGVKERTRRAVIESARRMGYISDAETITVLATKNDAMASSGKPSTFVFLLPDGTNTFITRLATQLETQGATRPALDVRVEMLEGFNAQSVSDRIVHLIDQTDGLGLIAQDHPLIREALRLYAAAGKPFVTLASDIQNVPSLAYVGIDNRQAGRLAGQILGRFLGRKNEFKIALLAGSLSYRGHEERENGFRNILREDFPNLHIVEMREIFDDRRRAYEETLSILAAHPDLSGIYNVGGGSQGVGRALRETGRGKEIVFIGHELTEDNRRMVLDGTMDALIDQNPRVEAREALNLLIAAVKGEAYAYIQPRLQMIFRENLPSE